MKNLFKIGIRILPVLTVLLLFYIGYLNFYGDRSQNSWFGPRYSKLDIAKATKKANQFFDAYFDSLMLYDPEKASRLGFNSNNSSWTDLSESTLSKKLSWQQRSLSYLKDSLRYDQLDTNSQISYELLKRQLEDQIALYEYRHFRYLVNQMHGVQDELPSFLKNVQKIKSVEDAEAYLSRLKAVPQKFEGLMQQLKLAEQINAIPPKFLFPKFIESSENIIKGRPMKPLGLKKNIIFEDFEQKVSKLEIDKKLKDSLISASMDILKNEFKSSYEGLISYLKDLSKKANNNAGLWKIENGEEYYKLLLKTQTTTDLSPDEIYDLGQEEIERIHGEMRQIMQKVGFKGDLQAFFEFMRNDPQFYYSNKEKERYLKDTRAIIDSMRTKLPDYFHRLPAAKLEVKLVEAYREKAAGKAFYQAPAANGSRPGIYYVNSYDMRMVPKYSMQALAYHEAIPGHHMQIALMQEKKDLPKFRRYGHFYNAYVEGWGLYAEFLPKEMGAYQDPYADFGRLAMELWRSCRLVVDVGIHSKRWSRNQAIQFYKMNTPNSDLDCEKMVDRHIVMPAQATTYKIGMISLLELRKKAKTALGDQFDIRDFHQVVLDNGALPLDLLEDLIDNYIAKKRK
jgi:uncharacterized protein (DUF885 family)